MDDFPWGEILFLFHNHQENVRRMLKASNERTLRRIRTSRLNLQRAKEASFALLLENMVTGASGAAISVRNNVPYFLRLFHKMK